MLLGSWGMPSSEKLGVDGLLVWAVWDLRAVGAVEDSGLRVEGVGFKGL